MFCLFKHKAHEAPLSSFNVKGLKTEPLSVNDGIIGWIKGVFADPESATKEKLDALWQDVQALGHQDFEDVCALYCTAAFFQDEKLQRKSAKRLYGLLEKRQELSAAELELVLDCINIGERMAVNGVTLREYVSNDLLRQNDEMLLDYARRLYVI